MNFVRTTPCYAVPQSAAALMGLYQKRLADERSAYNWVEPEERVATFGTKSAVGCQDCTEGNQSGQKLC